MVYGVSGSSNSNSINPFQGSQPLGFKHKALHNWLSESSADSFENGDGLHKQESFNDKGQRIITYMDSQNKPVKSITFDATTGKKLTQNHYVGGVLSQVDTLDDNGNVIKTHMVNNKGNKDNSGWYNSSARPLTGNSVVTYDPVTGLMSGHQVYDSATGALLVNAVYENGNVKTVTAYDAVTNNATSYIEMDSTTCQPIQTATYDGATGATLTTKKFDAAGNLTETTGI